MDQVDLNADDQTHAQFYEKLKGGGNPFPKHRNTFPILTHLTWLHMTLSFVLQEPKKSL